MIRFPYCYKLELLNIFLDDLYDLKVDLKEDYDINIKILDNDDSYNKILNLPMYIRYIPEYLGEELLSINSDVLRKVIFKNMGLNITSNISLQRCFFINIYNLSYEKGIKEASIYLYVDKENICNLKYGLCIFLNYHYLKYGIDKENFDTDINKYIKSTYDKYKISYGK